MVGQSLQGWVWTGSVPACAGKCPVLMGTESQPLSIQSQILTSLGGSAVESFPRALLGGECCRVGDPRQGWADRGALWHRHSGKPRAGPGREPTLGRVTCWEAEVPGLGKEGWASWRQRNQASISCPLCQHSKCIARAGAGPALGPGLRVSVSSHPGILAREGTTRDKAQQLHMVPAAFSGSQCLGTT